MVRRICHFTGKVQGVGFRYTAQNLALSHDVNGFVRNLPDGRVELVMEGPDGEMDDVIHTLQRRMDGYIKGLHVDVAPATGEFQQFYIKH